MGFDAVFSLLFQFTSKPDKPGNVVLPGPIVGWAKLAEAFSSVTMHKQLFGLANHISVCFTIIIGEVFRPHILRWRILSALAAKFISFGLRSLL